MKVNPWKVALICLYLWWGAATDSTQVSSGVGGKRTVFKSGDDLEDDFQDDEKAEPDSSERSDDAVDDEPEDTASTPMTLKSNNKNTSRTLPSGKLNTGKYNPKVVKFWPRWFLWSD